MNKKLILKRQLWQLQLLAVFPLLILIGCGSQPETETLEIESDKKVETSLAPPPAPQNVQSRPATIPQASRGLTQESADIAQIQTVPNSRTQSNLADTTVEAPSSNTEQYNLINDNPFKAVKNNPLSTFSIDVDTASYSNLRRFIAEGRLPPKDAVRIEELINYFTYDYPQPEANNSFSLTTEISDSPWNSQHKLVHIGIQGKDIVTENLPSSNLVFLLDVSG
ncbi:MAG: von Willebrand factor type A domain-containing protein, partial [Microcoleaceae cyanobacterium]